MEEVHGVLAGARRKNPAIEQQEAEYRFERQMDLIGAAGIFSHRSDRGMQHDGLARGDAQVTKVIRQFPGRVHRLSSRFVTSS